MAHALSLSLALYAFWLLLSGHYQLLLLSLGVLSVMLVVMLTLRMDAVDRQGHPLHLSLLKLPLYWLWLGWEVIKSTIDVTRRIWAPSLPISPQRVRLKANQKTLLGKVIYANSITLTPGTVSIDVTEDGIEVHALTHAAAAALQTGEMDRKICDMVE